MCRGFDTWGPLWLTGGLNWRHPGERDLVRAREFAGRVAGAGVSVRPGHADGIKHADLDAGERVLREMIYECQRSLEAIGHAKLELEAGGRGREG